MNREVHVRFWESPEVKVLRATRQKLYLSSVRLCEGFRMPAHDDGATLSGAGVRKPSREETAEVWRSGASDAMGILALAVYRRGALRKRSMEWRVRSADRDSQKRRCATEVARQGSCPGRRGGEHGHCGSRAGEAEVQHWNVAANRV
jgi:hypothetical protein